MVRANIMDNMNNNHGVLMPGYSVSDKSDQ